MLVSLIGGMAASAQAAVPTLNNPGPQESVAGTPITPLKIKGTEIEGVTQSGLPEGLTAQVTAGEVEITGKPLEPEVAKVILHATNTEGPSAPVEFKWTVREPPPSLTTPADQTSTAGTPIAPVTIKGERMQELNVEDLPKGLTLILKNETEAVISGTPEKAEVATVKLTAVDSEKQKRRRPSNGRSPPNPSPRSRRPLPRSARRGARSRR